MVGFGKNKIIPLTLTQEERYCILDYCPDLHHAILDKVGLAKDGKLYLMEKEADLLKTYVCYTTQRVHDQKVSAILDRLIDKIALGNETRNLLERFSGMDPTDLEAFQNI